MLPQILIISISSVSILIIYIIKRKYKKTLNQFTEDGKFYHQLISVDMKNFNCKPHLFEDNLCNKWCSLSYKKTLQKFISSANLSICLCVYMLTLQSLNYELLMAHKRGVIIRVITDKGMIQTKPVKAHLKKLKENGKLYK